MDAPQAIRGAYYANALMNIHSLDFLAYRISDNYFPSVTVLLMFLCHRDIIPIRFIQFEITKRTWMS